MTPAQERLPVVIGAVFAVLLQVAVAPNIHIMLAMPNFVLCYVVACAISNARSAGYIMPFVCGLLYDFMGSGPIGAMALVCLLATLFASSLFKALDNESLFLPVLIIVVTVLLSELAYGLLMIACGVGVGLLEALVDVCLPCGLYDTVLTLVAFPLVRRFVFKGRQQNEMTIIDSGSAR